MALITRFVEPITKLLIGNRSSRKRRIYRPGDKIVLGVGGGRKGLFGRRAFIDVKFLKLGGVILVHNAIKYEARA